MPVIRDKSVVYKVGSPVLFTLCLVFTAVIIWSGTLISCTVNQGTRSLLIRYEVKQTKQSIVRLNERLKHDSPFIETIDEQAINQDTKIETDLQKKSLACFPVPRNN